MEADNDAESWFQDFVAGWFAGAAGLVVGHPFDTVKARIQTDKENVFGNRFRTWTCLRQIIEREGPRALYKGMLSPLVGMAAINSVVFGVHANVLQRLQPEGGLPSIWKSFTAGAIGGLAQVWICCPMELIKLRMQAQKNPVPLLGVAPKASDVRLYSDPWDCTRKLFAEGHKCRGVIGGIGSLNQGFVVTLYREIPAFGCYFAAYNYLCKLSLRFRHNNSRNSDDLHPVELFMAGGIAGIVAWVVTYPFDVVKSRLQVDGMDGKRIYKGMIHGFRESYKEEFRELEIEYERDPDSKPRPTKWRAMRVFVKGVNSTILRAFPLNAVTFLTYALILRYWRNSTSSD